MSGLTGVGEGNDPQNDGPHVIEKVCREGVVGDWVASNVFQNVVTMGMHNDI